MSDEAKNPTAGHEAHDVPARIPVYSIAFMAVFVPLILLILWGLVATVWEELPDPPNPFAGEPIEAPSAPSLQIAPEKDLAELNRDMNKRLTGVGWIDREAGRVHLPIDRAMRLLLERGLPEQGERASDRIGLAEPPVAKAVDATVSEAVDVSAARTVVAPGENGERDDRQEAGNER